MPSSSQAFESNTIEHSEQVSGGTTNDRPKSEEIISENLLHMDATEKSKNVPESQENLESEPQEPQLSTDQVNKHSGSSHTVQHKQRSNLQTISEDPREGDSPVILNSFQALANAINRSIAAGSKEDREDQMDEKSQAAEKQKIPESPKLDRNSGVSPQKDNTFFLSGEPRGSMARQKRKLSPVKSPNKRRKSITLGTVHLPADTYDSLVQLTSPKKSRQYPIWSPIQGTNDIEPSVSSNVERNGKDQTSQGNNQAQQCNPTIGSAKIIRFPVSDQVSKSDEEQLCENNGDEENEARRFSTGKTMTRSERKNLKIKYKLKHIRNRLLPDGGFEPLSFKVNRSISKDFGSPTKDFTPELVKCEDDISDHEIDKDIQCYIRNKKEIDLLKGMQGKFGKLGKSDT